jgi:hypothetical protein
MRPRGPLISTSALGLAVLAVAVVAVWTSVNHVRTINAKTIRIKGPDIVFAPPPGDARAMTARQARASYSGGKQDH